MIHYLLLITRDLRIVESGAIHCYGDLDIGRYAVSKTTKKVTAARGWAKKQATESIELHLQDAEDPLEAIFDAPETLRLSPAPKPMRFACLKFNSTR